MRSPFILAALIATTIAATTAVSSAAPAAQELPGYDRLTIHPPHRAEAVAASVWYPAASPTYRGEVGANPVFRGQRVMMGPPVAPGRHPLVVLSHGSGGNMDGLGWLSAGLVARGAMVLAVNHPGSTSGDSSPRRSLLLDERAADLSRALDALMASPDFAPFVDPDRITAAGFSLGGGTALQLGGMRLDRDAFADWCAAVDVGNSRADCSFFARGGVDFARLPDGFAADLRDARISAVAALDPAFTHSATDDSVAAMTLPVLVVNLGEAGAGLWPAADAGSTGSDMVARLPDGRLVVIAPATHFTALSECTPEAPALLEDEGDDPVCTDPEGTDRAAVHAAVVDAIADFIGL